VKITLKLKESVKIQAIIKRKKHEELSKILKISFPNYLWEIIMRNSW